MTEQDLIHKIEWVNKRCSLKGEPLTQSQIELLKFVFADTVVNKNFALADVSGQSELLIAFADWVFNQPKHLGGRERELVAEYLKAINSH